MTARRILITRSQPGADETAQRVRELGYEPIVAPMFSIEALHPALPSFDVLAFTSANGVRQFCALSDERDVPVYCVGGRTAASANAAGFGNVTSANGDVEALADLLIGAAMPGSRILHSGNETPRGDLVGSLKRHGFFAEFVATYRTLAVERVDGVLGEHLSGTPKLDAILVHSPKAAAVLEGFVSRKSAPLNLVAISRQSVLKLSLLADSVTIADAPNEDALMDALNVCLSKA